MFRCCSLKRAVELLERSRNSSGVKRGLQHLLQLQNKNNSGQVSSPLIATAVLSSSSSLQMIRWWGSATGGSSSDDGVDGEDPASTVMNGGAKITDLTENEIRTALDYRKISHDGCDTMQALRKRLIQDLVVEARDEQAAMGPEHLDYDVYLDKYGDSIARLPMRMFVLSTAITGLEREVIVNVPQWDCEWWERAAASEEFSDLKFSFGKHRAIIARHYEQERSGSVRFSMADISNMAKSALICFLFADGDYKAGGVRQLSPEEIMMLQQEEDKFHDLVIADSPVPKGWKFTPPPGMSLEFLEEMLEAVEDTRQRLGETDPLP